VYVRICIFEASCRACKTYPQIHPYVHSHAHPHELSPILTDPHSIFPLPHALVYHEAKGGYDESARSATHCNTLQHTATHCSTLNHTAPHYILTSAHCTTRQAKQIAMQQRGLCITTTHYNTNIVTHCNTRQAKRSRDEAARPRQFPDNSRAIAAGANYAQSRARENRKSGSENLY